MRIKETRVTLLRMTLAAAAATALAAPAAAATADDTFNAFKQVCGDTHADYAAAVSAAQKSGWKTTDAMADTMKGVTITDKAARTRTITDQTLLLFATRGTAKAGGGDVGVQTCTVQTDRGAFPDLTARTQAWLGMPPAATTDVTATFRFTQDAGAYKAVAASELDAAAAGAGMDIVTVRRDGSKATLDFVKIKK
jgi:hypothetical protein